MAMSYVSLLPNEMIDNISQELTGIDLFHFTLVFEWRLNISNYQLLKLLRGQRAYMLTNEIKSLIDMLNSPYIIVEQGVGLMLSSLKWNNFVYGPFKLKVIEKSLKYCSTTMFSLYCRLWSFNPFCYKSSYPTLNIFEYPGIINVFFKKLNNNSLEIDQKCTFSSLSKCVQPKFL